MRECAVYMLLCRDGSYYTGVTNNVDARVVQHQLGLDENCYTFDRRPVKLVFASEYLAPDQAIRLEKKIKGWSHAKKGALIRGDWNTIKRLARSSRPDTRTMRAEGPSTSSG